MIFQHPLACVTWHADAKSENENCDFNEPSLEMRDS